MVATKVVGSEAATPIEWAAKGAVVVMETQRPDDNRRVAISGTNVTWTINGRSAPLDSLADRWQKLVVELLDASFEADELRRQVTSMRTEIDSLPARRLATESRIKSLEHLEAELNRALLAERTRESSLRSDLSRLEMQRSDYQRRGAAEDRRAAAARDDRARAAAQANARSYYTRAQELGERIRQIESDSRNSNSARKLVELQEQLRSLDDQGNLALLRMRLTNYNSTNVEEIEQRITQLNATERLPDLDARVEKAHRALLAILR